MTKLIPIAKPEILKSDIKLASKALKDGWNKKHTQFIKKLNIELLELEIQYIQ